MCYCQSDHPTAVQEQSETASSHNVEAQSGSGRSAGRPAPQSVSSGHAGPSLPGELSSNSSLTASADTCQPPLFGVQEPCVANFMLGYAEILVPRKTHCPGIDTCTCLQCALLHAGQPVTAPICQGPSFQAPILAFTQPQVRTTQWPAMYTLMRCVSNCDCLVLRKCSTL